MLFLFLLNLFKPQSHNYAYFAKTRSHDVRAMKEKENPEEEEKKELKLVREALQTTKTFNLKREIFES